jgi:hypothetical protein
MTMTTMQRRHLKLERPARQARPQQRQAQRKRHLLPLLVHHLPAFISLTRQEK